MGEHNEVIWNCLWCHMWLMDMGDCIAHSQVQSLRISLFPPFQKSVVILTAASSSYVKQSAQVKKICVDGTMATSYRKDLLSNQQHDICHGKCDLAFVSDLKAACGDI